MRNPFAPKKVVAPPPTSPSSVPPTPPAPPAFAPPPPAAAPTEYRAAPLPPPTPPAFAPPPAPMPVPPPVFSAPPPLPAQAMPVAHGLQQSTDAVRNIRQNLPGTVLAFIADMDTGLLEYSEGQNASTDAEVIAGYYAQVLRQEWRALQAVGADHQRMQNMVFQTSRQHHALYPLAGQRFLCVIADQRQVNLAMMWRLLNSFAPQLLRS